MIRAFWVWVSGFASALALASVARHDWVALTLFIIASVGALVVALRGWLGAEETCRHGNRVADGTAEYRRVRLAVVPTEKRP